MENIINLIEFAIANTGEPVSMRIEQFEYAAPYTASLHNADSGDLMTLAGDWDELFQATGATVGEAVENLDKLCAKDLAECLPTWRNEQ